MISYLTTVWGAGPGPSRLGGERAAMGRGSAALVLVPLWMSCLVAGAEAQTTWHVDAAAPGPTRDGAGWCTAFVDLQDAIAAAAAGDEIRVADGVYKPDRGTGNRSASFTLKSGVVLAGGYAGCGAPDPSARDFDLYPAVLSGDLAGNDGADFANYAENSYHVVTYDDPAATGVVFDGFTVSGGNANGPTALNNQGGGIHIRQGLVKCLPGGPTIRNCIVEKNWGAHHGAINDHGLSTVLENCLIRGNYSAQEGGGLQIHSGSPTVTACTFINNTSGGQGGGAWAGSDTDATCSGPSSARFVDCLFEGNGAQVGGGVYNKGTSNSVFENCVFRANSAFEGAGMYLEAATNATIDRCAFHQNSATSEGGGTYNNGSTSTYLSCTFTANTGGVYAGGMRNRSSPTVVKESLFANNFSGGNGGAMHNRLSNARFDRCRFVGNSAILEGGALFNTEESNLVVTNSLFTGNLAQRFGGAIQNHLDTFPELNNCTLYANSAGRPDGGGAIVSDDLSGTSLTDCIVWHHIGGAFAGDGPLTAVYSNIEGGYPGTGNLNVAPMFEDADGADNVSGTEDDDLRLKPGSVGSNAGDPGFLAALDEQDLAGGPRLVGCRVDMGAYESGSLSMPGDFNGDHMVNLADFARFQLYAFDAAWDSQWAGYAVCVFDFDGSEFIDLADYALFPWNMIVCETAASCDDGDDCNGVELCVGGTCQPGAALDCDDGNVCTDDACEGGACVHSDNAADCDDGNPCTLGDSCQAGECAGGSEPDCSSFGGQCQSASCDPTGAAGNCDTLTPSADGAGCDDGDPCHVGEACQNGLCSGGSPQGCSSFGDDCNVASCDPAGPEGNCLIRTPLADETPCDDGDVCNVGEVCTAGACGGGSAVNCLSAGDQCNTASCDDGGEEGNCDVLTPVTDGTLCDDGLHCTDGDECIAGTCEPGSGLDCSSLDTQCRIGVCDEDANDCVLQDRSNGTGCDNGPCVTGETCQSGVCSGGSAVNCSTAGDTCNDASCDAGGSEGNCAVLTPKPDNTACDDNLYCTHSDKCVSGACTNVVIRDCSNIDTECRMGVCDEGSDSCVLQDRPDGTPCDGVACNVGETCTSGVCSGGSAVNCSTSGDTCNTALCDAGGLEGNCDTLTPAANGTPCDDGLFCTVNDSCLDGDCVDTDEQSCAHLDTQCQVGVCDVGSDACVAQDRPDGTGCDNGACVTGETCQSGVCTGGSAMDCTTAGDDCNTASCDSNASEGNCAILTPLTDGTACEDGLHCTDGDQCIAGTCEPGHALDCAHLDTDCRVGVCDDDLGDCVLQDRPDGTPCDDFDPCNTGEECAGGICGGGSAVDCSLSGDQCNDVSCSASGSEGNCDTLTPMADGAGCDNGPCVTGETCTSGVCGGGSAVDCATAGDDCNTASCDEGGAEGNCALLAPQPNGTTCDDNLFCTVTDSCVGGDCVGVGNPDCSHLNTDCQVGVCDPEADDCVTQDVPNGTACDTGNVCSSNDTCQGGVCTGGPGPDCSMFNTECTAGACNPAGAEGNCDQLNAVDDGTPCPDDNLCDGDESCVNGNCVDNGTPVVCEEPLVCDRETGECVIDEPGVCATSDDCPGTQVCAFDLVCRRPCDGDDDCRTNMTCLTDVSVPVCVLLCTDVSECPTGQICGDGFCRAAE